MQKLGNWLIAVLLGTVLLVWDIFNTFGLDNEGEIFQYLGLIHLALWIMMILAVRVALAAMSFAMSGLSKILGVNEEEPVSEAASTTEAKSLDQSAEEKELS